MFRIPIATYRLQFNAQFNASTHEPPNFAMSFAEWHTQAHKFVGKIGREYRVVQRSPHPFGPRFQCGYRSGGDP